MCAHAYMRAHYAFDQHKSTYTDRTTHTRPGNVCTHIHTIFIYMFSFFCSVYELIRLDAHVLKSIFIYFVPAHESIKRSENTLI